MSTYNCLCRWHKGLGAPVFSILGGILISLQFMLPPIAFAAIPTSDFSFGMSQPLDRASVSVVRLLVSYTTPATPSIKVPSLHPTPPTTIPTSPITLPTSPIVRSTSIPHATSTSTLQPTATPVLGGATVPGIQCTGLGVLVRSWISTSPTELNNWVLTDGALADPHTPTCRPGTPSAQLASIQVVVSTAYTSTPLSPALTVESAQIQCETANNVCHGTSLALLPFHTNASHTQPFLGLETTAQAGQMGIELQDASHTIPPQGSIDAQQAQQYLTPKTVTFPNAQQQNLLLYEAGMPIVNAQGLLTGIQPRSGSSYSASRISTFLTAVPSLSATQPAHQNLVQTSWDQGVTDYYAQPPQYQEAVHQFQTAFNANSSFQAADLFRRQATNEAGGTQNNQPGSGANTQTPGIDAFGLHIPLWPLLIAGLVLLMLLLVFVSLTFGRKRVQRHRDLAQFEQERRTAEQKAALDAQRMAREEAQRRQPQQAQAWQQPVAPDIDRRVPEHGQYIPNPAAVPPPSVAPVPPPAYTQPPSPLMPTNSISDMPTVDMSQMSHDGSRTNGPTETERTLPSYPVQQLQGGNIGMAVGPLSDPGIKRKHKPNEDSVLAVKGVPPPNSPAQQFGLFVVADGMGGHANGQDASRLAIQTIVNRMLPRLLSNEAYSDKDLEQLLIDGVQYANQAVHERNMEHHADMGTTMTAALVVGTIAYVANVGDSRTYLYREPEGLQKVTHDHSVVAHLVDAGIIKPDDIYTHPKRNQIYRSLGEKPSIDVDSFIVALQPGDKLLLCSDGLWDMVRDPEIQRILSMPVPDLTQTSNALIQAALEGGGEDNVSVIVVHVTESTALTGVTGIQLLMKPESVQLPSMG